MLDAEGVLIDGRNRLAACRLAGVAPRFASLNGQDPYAYILSSNVERRNLSKSQRVMARVLAALLPSYKRETQVELAQSLDVSQALISQALTVAENEQELADGVMTGALTVWEAYIAAKARQRQRESNAERVTRETEDLATLRAGAPDLAELVDEERMPLREALAAWRQREEEQAKARRDLTNDCGWALVTRGGESPRVQPMVFNCSTDQASRRRAGRVWGNAQAVNHFGIRSGQTAELVPPDDAAAD